MSPVVKHVPVNPELVPNLLKVFEFLIHAHQNESDYKNFKGLGPNRVKRVNVAKDYSFAVKKCLVSHRFTPSAELLDIICQQTRMDPIFFFKASSLFLENNSITSEDDFFKFTCLVHGLTDINKYEIVLEYLMHSLRNKDLEGYNILESVVFGQRFQAARNYIIDPLLKAYIGLLHYSKWAKSKGQENDENSEDSSMKVIMIFKELIENPGQWDIFVLKLVELLEFCDKHDEVESVLIKYAKINPEHTNSIIYLCDYYHKHQYSSEKHLECLKKLSECCPSDSRVLVYADLISSESPKKAFKILFLFLDYPCNREISKAWKMLSDLLTKSLEKSVLLEKIRYTWLDQRSHVWKYIHFFNRDLIVNDKTNAKIAINKSIVLCILENSSHPFIAAVQQLLPEVSQSLSLKLENKLSRINALTVLLNSSSKRRQSL